MHTVNLKPTDTELSRLVDLTRAGEEVVIARGGEPMVKLVPVSSGATAPRSREFGKWAGRIRIGDDFDDPLPEDMMRAFRGEAE